MATKADWTRNTDPDAEYNSHVTELNGHRLEVTSDRDATTWDYTIDGGEMRFGFDTIEEAMEAAEREARPE